MLSIKITPRTSDVRVVGVLDMKGHRWVVRENGQDVRTFQGAGSYNEAAALARQLRGAGA